MERLRTSIEGFDAMVQGGLPLGSSVVLQGPPGEEKLVFALTFLADGLKAGGSGLLAISSRSVGAALTQLRDLGVDVDAAVKENRLRVVDWYSWSEETVHDTEERGPVVRSSVDLTNLGVALSRAIAGLAGEQPPRAVIELLSPATNVHELTQVYAFAQSVKRKFDRHRFTSLVLIEKEMHSASELTTLHQPFDGVIEIERSRTGDRIVRKIGVLHLKDTAPDPTFHVLEMSEAGMQVVHDTPKPAASAPTAGEGVLESQEERARRLRLILQIATERLKLNPRDADALFATAAAQATLDDAKGGVQTLERLADVEPKYPGLWVLKTKLHARLGQADLARQSRLRSQLIEPEASKTITATVPCPMCEAPVAIDSTMCASCGAKFAPTRTLEDELEDLSHVAVQEMVEEELGVKAKGKPRGDVTPAKTEPKPSTEPTPKPAAPRSKQGFTTGLLLGGIVRRRQGATDGVRGRANARRGRTNGLTNGLGRTNGLTNGLTNELGRTNGLTNGLGRTNGLTNGLGRTNGITNGLGRTNGLTNGLGGVRTPEFRHLGSRGIIHNAGWKLYVIPLVVAGLLLWPLFSVPEHGPTYPIRIDGRFDDWASVAMEAMARGSGLNPDADIVRFGIVDNLGPFAFYVEVAGTALQGGGPSPGTMDSVRIFVDIDGSAATGYRIDGLGADRMIDISGHNGAVLSSTLWEFDSNRNQRDWNGWIKGTGTPAAASGSRIEAEAQWLSGRSSSVPVVATVHTVSWDEQTDSGDFPVSPGLGTLSVVSDPQVPDVISGGAVPLLRLTLTAHGQPVILDSLQIEIAGTAPSNAASALRLTDGVNVLAQATPASRAVPFSFAPIQIGAGASTTLFLVGDFASTTGETFGLRLPSTHPFGIGVGVVALKENPGARTLGYLGSIPSAPRVDGAFDEWTALSSDSTNDVAPRENSNIDLAQYGAQRSGGTTFLYTSVSGRILQGTPTPELPRQAPTSGSQGPADTDRDGVPDAIDPLPLDFDNNGIPDAQTNGDYDGDGLTDYGHPGGTDYWLNTTIPSTFPAPYAGRSVSLYIGPDDRPPALGDDVVRIFLDIDNSSFSGYSIGGIGADRLVEVRGKNGDVTQSAMLAFAGSFPGEWAWTPVSPVTVALGYHAVELSVLLNASKLVVESGDFWGSVDTTIVVSAFAPLKSSFKVSSAVDALALPWQQMGPQSTPTLIDPNSNAATTVNNQQRKVVRAGTVAGQTACDATNSAGCWYAVFYDQLAEEAAKAPSTETITLGTKVSGAFPTDISSEDGVFVQYRESTTSSEAAIAYRSNTGTNTVSSPKTRSWDGSSWGSESEQSTAGSPIRAVRVAPSPISSSWRIIVTESDDGWLDAYVCTPTCTVTNNIGQVWSTAPGTPERRFDIAYENTSGDALLVYGVLSTNTTHDIAYRTYSGGSWSAEQYLDDPGHATDVQYTQIDLAPKKGSDMIGMIGGDDTFDEANAWIWDGNAWGSYTQITGSMQSPNYRQVALAWESSSGNLLAVAALATSNDIISKEYSTSWSGTSQFTCASGSGMTKHIFWLSLKANPLATANDVLLGLVQENYDLNTCYWTGSAWSSWNQHDTDYDAVQTRAFDFAWEGSGSKGLLVWGTSRTTGGGQITYKTFTAPNTWGPQTNVAMGSGFDQWVQLRTNPFSGTVKILGAVLDSNRLLGAIKWDGSAFTVIGANTFSADDGATAAYEGFDLRYRATNDGRLSVKYDFASVPAGDAYTLKIKGYRGDENVNVEVLTPPSSWNPRITIAATTNTLYAYNLTNSEYNSGAPSIRFIDALGSDAVTSDLYLDLSVIASKTIWDRVILMRSLDTGGSMWGPQVILASGRTGDNPLIYSYDSAEPSIAMDASGYLHIVWVSAALSGNQQMLNLVRYAKTIVAYPTQSQTASSASWQNVSLVDDADSGYMPTVSTDTSNNPHIAWSGSKTSGTVYYKNKAGGTWRSTVSWGTTYSGVSVDVSPLKDYVSLVRYYEAATNEVQYTVCKNLSVSLCAASNNFTKSDGTAGFDTIDTSVEDHSYPSLATTYEANGDLWVAYAKNAAGSNINSVQKGVTQIADTSSSTSVTMAPVDTTKAFLVFNVRHNRNAPSDGTISGSIASPTSLTFARYGTSGPVDIEWYVAEFTSGVSVQRGTTVLNGVDNDQNIPISTVDLSKSVPIISYTENGQTYNCDDFHRATLTSTTNLQISSCAPDSTVEWQVVQFTSSSVQTGLVTFATSDAAKTAGLSPSVNVGKSWLLFSYNITGGTDTNIGQKMVRGQLSSASLLTFDRDASATGARIDLRWYLVEFTDGTTTQRGSASFATTDTQKDVALSPAVSTSWTIAFTGASAPYGDGKTPFSTDDNPGPALATLDITSSTNLRVTRATTQLSTADIGWFTIQFPASRTIFARFLDYPSGAWASPETIDAMNSRVFTKPSIGIDASNNVHALYVDVSGPQLYYNGRTGGSWGARLAVDTTSDNPTLIVRGPNDATFGSNPGALYWKTSSSETYFYYVPEFDEVILPILGSILVALFLGRRTRSARRDAPAS